MQSKASTVEEYIDELPLDRRIAIEAVRKVIKQNLASEMIEHMAYGMIGYSVPHSVYPAGYHCDPKMPLPVGGLASQKQYMSFYIMGVYYDPAELAWFESEWAKSGKKLDMGKCCVRFRKLEDLPLDVIGRLVKRTTTKKVIQTYEAARREQEKGREARSGGKGAAKKPVKKTAKKASKKTSKKKTAR